MHGATAKNMYCGEFSFFKNYYLCDQ